MSIRIGILFIFVAYQLSACKVQSKTEQECIYGGVKQLCGSLQIISYKIAFSETLLMVEKYVKQHNGQVISSDSDLHEIKIRFDNIAPKTMSAHSADLLNMRFIKRVNYVSLTKID
ncbi:hypothetical protein C7Y70_14670 [Pseudoalteromonas sp. KS88]|uniref:hypothetical protein n=1 Tax=Pseudoalteromonas sp. KS88 TaxID=2109918 RepID=UPI001080555F|nr:hypothetical protein [Pseudoalteromonas sp. KS88]TGE79938.1 hypothetical protein C7Y70_14670 [Pseudoalteromonas sp. KS88]